MIKKKILLIFIIFSPILLLAQSNVAGKVVDGETGEPIDIVSIYTHPNGTITNELGEFVLRTDSDTLFVSHLRYHPKKVATTGEYLNIALVPKRISVDAAVIRPHALLQGVYEKYTNIFDSYRKQDKEFPKASFYYRQTTFQDGLNTEFIECFFNGTATTSVENLAIEQGRYAKITDTTQRLFHFSNAYVFSYYSPVTVHKLKKRRYVAPLCRGWSRIFDIKLESLVEANTPDEIRVYRFIPKRKQPANIKTIIGGSLHIRTRDSTIVKFVGESETLDLYTAKGAKILSQKLNLTITYKESEPFPIAESFKMQLELEYLRNNEVSSLNVNTIMYATTYNADTEDSEDRLKDGDLVKSLKEHKYDPVFWQDNPIIKRTPIENKIIKDFNRLGYFGNFEL